MCDTLKKKCKRSFLDAWLKDDRYKFWIRKVSFDDSLFHCMQQKVFSQFVHSKTCKFYVS